MAKKKLIEDEDFYMEGEKTVLTAEYHIKRGFCCGSGCKECPYDPEYQRGTLTLKEKFQKKDSKKFDN